MSGEAPVYSAGPHDRPDGIHGPRPGGGPHLQDLYAPIQKDLERLDSFLRAEFKSEEPFIGQLLAHISRYRGKQIRPALLLLAGRFSGPDVTDDHVKIAAVIELIHTATLVHDDILDDAALRRNVETLHRRWGERAGVLLGDYIYSRAFALSTEVVGMASILSATAHTICEGELLQIGTRFRPDIGEDLYFEIIRKKTAILYAVAAYLGGVLSGASGPDAIRLHEYGMDLGMAFQIIDDCLDYAGNEAVVGKSLGTDLHQGKMTLPLLYLLGGIGREEGAQLLESLRRPMTRATEERIASGVREQGALEEARARARAFIDSARAHAAGLEPALREPLSRVADYVLRRQS
jgi:octaprenyl-diphosphate synthase